MNKPQNNLKRTTVFSIGKDGKMKRKRNKIRNLDMSGKSLPDIAR